MELTSGADHPGSIASLADSPGTAFVYDVGLGDKSQLVMAGQFSHEDGSTAGGFAGEWLPSGQAGVGPVTTILGARIAARAGRSGVSGLAVVARRSARAGRSVSVRYGAEF